VVAVVLITLEELLETEDLVVVEMDLLLP